MSDAPIRDAATIIVVRDAANDPKVLMGQRGAKAAFMPDKMVFPGGAVDPDDAEVALAGAVARLCDSRLNTHSEVGANTLVATALRELCEETGLCLGCRGAWPDAPTGWERFRENNMRPSADTLRFFFRAVTPPGRPRRFDARFFLADAAAIHGDLDDFTKADAELSHLQWVPLADVRALNLAFITRLVLAELDQHLPSLEAPEAVPLVRNDALDRGVIWLR